jgi:triosephosphate isomerase
MEKFIIANWKSYINLDKAISILDTIKQASNLIVAPSFAHLSYLCKKYPNINFASQDISSVSGDYGAYTGENVASLLKEDLSINYAIIGHSERRSNKLDDSDSLKKKLHLANENKINPIFCIGESLDQRKSGQYRSIIESEIDSVLPKIKDNAENGQKFIIAYEPFWSIGTGLIPTREEIGEIAEIIKSKVNFVDKRIFLVYGGSVNNDNAKEILSIDNIDGLLIGGASTDAKKLNSIIDLI